jgi:CRISPR-associated endonuclease/helicase Cas3
MTSLEEHTGRPEIGPWLRGWTDEEAKTTVIWRTYLPVRDRQRVSDKETEAFFEAAPPHASEALETETHEVINWLTARAKAIRKEQDRGHRDSPFGETEPLAVALSPAGDFRRVLTLGDFSVEEEDKRAKEKKEATWKALTGKTLVVDARVAGLRDGLLDNSESSIPRTVDDGQEWLPSVEGDPVVRFRIHTVESTASLPPDSQWKPRHRFETTRSEEGESTGGLIIEKWRSDSATEEDRAVGFCQLLDVHQKLAEERARELASRLGLVGDYAGLLAIAARLHDEGKRSPRWQRAFNAPRDGQLYAKTEGPVNVARLDGYRHEFSSLEVAAKDANLLELPRELQELALHLIAAHHGFGRPTIRISGCDDAPPSKLEVRAREVSLRFARLQQRWGPWGLAWWESLLRAADQQASRR